MNEKKLSGILGAMQIIGLVLTVLSLISPLGLGMAICISICGLAAVAQPILRPTQRDKLTIVAALAGLGIIVLTILRLNSQIQGQSPNQRKDGQHQTGMKVPVLILNTNLNGYFKNVSAPDGAV